MANKKSKTSPAAAKNAAPKVLAAQIANAKEQIKTVQDKKAVYKKADKILVLIKEPVTGRFNLPYFVGQEVEIESKQAGDLIESGYAVLVDKKA
jgi:hypothetical protein